MSIVYVRLRPTSSHVVAITLDVRANQCTAIDVDGGRYCERLSEGGIARLVSNARRGWSPVVNVSDIDGELADDAAQAWDRETTTVTAVGVES